jgi:hypothetical protein
MGEKISTRRAQKHNIYELADSYNVSISTIRVTRAA